MAYSLPDIAITGAVIEAAWGNAARSSLAETAPGLAAAKGDLWTATGANAGEMLAVGANDEIPIADSGESGGIKWGGLEGCRLSLSGAFTTATAVSNPIDWDVEDWDTSGLHESVTNPERITILTAGIYLVTAGVNFNVDATGRRVLGFQLNGTDVAPLMTIPAEDGFTTEIGIAGIMELGPADYVAASAIQRSGGDLDILAVRSYFAIQKLRVAP